MNVTPTEEINFLKTVLADEKTHSDNLARIFRDRFDVLTEARKYAEGQARELELEVVGLKTYIAKVEREIEVLRATVSGYDAAAKEASNGDSERP